jgi:hypothetical protein
MLEAPLISHPATAENLLLHIVIYFPLYDDMSPWKDKVTYFVLKLH